MVRYTKRKQKKTISRQRRRLKTKRRGGGGKCSLIYLKNYDEFLNKNQLNQYITVRNRDEVTSFLGNTECKKNHLLHDKGNVYINSELLTRYILASKSGLANFLNRLFEDYNLEEYQKTFLFQIKEIIKKIKEQLLNCVREKTNQLDGKQLRHYIHNELQHIIIDLSEKLQRIARNYSNNWVQMFVDFYRNIDGLLGDCNSGYFQNYKSYSGIELDDKCGGDRKKCIGPDIIHRAEIIQKSNIRPDRKAPEKPPHASTFRSAPPARPTRGAVAFLDGPPARPLSGPVVKQLPTNLYEATNDDEEEEEEIQRPNRPISYLTPPSSPHVGDRGVKPEVSQRPTKYWSKAVNENNIPYYYQVAKFKNGHEVVIPNSQTWTKPEDEYV
jgi:hypothetical protein